jgi:hypothetical protein
MLVSAAGLGLASELDLVSFLLASDDDRLDFGELEPLVTLMQETDADALMARAADELARGTELRTLVAAAALANARTFGGQDYTGYHCFMALIPALEMASRLPGRQAALPVLKVLHRNARTIQGQGGRRNETLHRVRSADGLAAELQGKMIQAARKGSYGDAEAAFARIMEGGPAVAFASLQPLVRDNIDVHQVVLAYRSWDMMRLAGESNAHTLLRQTLRECIDRDMGRRNQGKPEPGIRALLPRLLEEHRLGRPVEQRSYLNDEESMDLARFFCGTQRDAAAERMAMLLAMGVSPVDLGEALSQASALLLLHDPGLARGQAGKPAGSVHGASVGLHASDSANAWRAIASVSSAENAHASLVTAAWHTAGQSFGMDTGKLWHEDAKEAASRVKKADLLPAISEAIRGRDQKTAAALAERYGETGGDHAKLEELLIEPAVTFDGALHHEKYYQTATEEFARTRASLRWNHLVALTRVMASGCGFEAPGLAEAKKRLGV